MAALQQQTHPLRYPPKERPPRVPLPKPETGHCHLVRFMRSKLSLDVFGEHFPLPPETEYKYVIATVDVTFQRLSVRLRDDLIMDLPYELRSADSPSTGLTGSCPRARSNPAVCTL